MKQAQEFHDVKATANELWIS